DCCTCRCDVRRIGKLVDGTDLMTTILSYFAAKMVESTLTCTQDYRSSKDKVAGRLSINEQNSCCHRWWNCRIGDGASIAPAISVHQAASLGERKWSRSPSDWPQ